MTATLINACTTPTPIPDAKVEAPAEEAPPRRVPYDPNIRGNPGDVEIPNRIFVKGFPKEATDDEIKTYFEAYGIVRDVKIVRDKCGMSKGYAFVTFDSQEIAEKVKEIEVLQHKDREIVIGPAKIRKKRPNFLNFAAGLGFRRPDQMGYMPSYSPLVGSPIAAGSPTYAVSPDGLWCFQVNTPPMHSFSPLSVQSSAASPPVQYQQQLEYQPMAQSQYVQQQAVWPVAPQQVPVTIIQSGPPAAPQVAPSSAPLTTNQPLTTVNSNTTFPFNFSQAMNNLTLNDYVKMTSRKMSSPTEGLEYQQMQQHPVPTSVSSPVQCVPVYENTLLDEACMHDNMDGSNVVYVTDGASKIPMKTVMLKREMPPPQYVSNVTNAFQANAPQQPQHSIM